MLDDFTKKLIENVAKLQERHEELDVEHEILLQKKSNLVERKAPQLRCWELRKQISLLEKEVLISCAKIIINGYNDCDALAYREIHELMNDAIRQYTCTQREAEE